jgi:hypothetical protein
MGIYSCPICNMQVAPMVPRPGLGALVLNADGKRLEQARCRSCQAWLERTLYEPWHVADPPSATLEELAFDPRR